MISIKKEEEEGVDHISSIKKLIEEFTKLNLLEEDQLTELLDTNKKESYELLMHMGSFISNTCGNINKLYEKTTELNLSITSNSKTQCIKHIKNAYGPDLIINDEEYDIDDYIDSILGEEEEEEEIIKDNTSNTTTKIKTHVEVKSSTVKINKTFASNWMFNTLIANNAITEQHIYESIKMKYQGIVLLNAIHKSITINTYRISGTFISLLFTKKFMYIINNGGIRPHNFVVNLGCKRCTVHNTYHKIEKYVKYDKIMKNRMIANNNDVFSSITDIEWGDILKKQDQCKK